MNRLVTLACLTCLAIPLAHADEVFLDDVAIDGSLCVGLDCVNGEDFDFHTVRLKENNLRIGFVDTSNTAQFPTADWQITINDSNNGGDSYFAIETLTPSATVPFRVNAGADSNSLLVGSNGYTGFGTASPARHLHVVDGNAPTLRLQQDGTGGFTPITWDIGTNEDALTISVDGTTIFTLETNGDLTIAGTLTAGNPPVDFPDYVFSPTYQLMPLDQLQQYVSANSHLPGIPSASDVAANGINMTELQVNLLKKVEELTLYTLQQQALISELTEQVQALQAQN